MISVFLLDDHEVVRRGVAAMIDAEDDMVVVGQAGSAEEAIEGIEQSCPDVAVIDVRLGDGNGLDVCREVTERFGDVRSLILTSFDSDRALVEAGAAGAAGFVLKRIRGGELLEAVRNVANGRQLLDEAEVRLAERRLRSGEELGP